MATVVELKVYRSGEKASVITEKLLAATFPAWDRELLVQDQRTGATMYLAGSWSGGCT